MTLLLDTHAFLWIVEGDDRLSERAAAAFLDADNRVSFSAASYWEICIKIGLGRLDLGPDWPRRFEREMRVNTIGWLPIEAEHCRVVVDLPMHHRDPFDRLLIAQARHERLTLVSGDSALGRYDVPTLW